jgi:hypothetical protein
MGYEAIWLPGCSSHSFSLPQMSSCRAAQRNSILLPCRHGLFPTTGLGLFQGAVHTCQQVGMLLPVVRRGQLHSCGKHRELDAPGHAQRLAAVAGTCGCCTWPCRRWWRVRWRPGSWPRKRCRGGGAAAHPQDSPMTDFPWAWHSCSRWSYSDNLLRFEGTVHRYHSAILAQGTLL